MIIALKVSPLLCLLAALALTACARTPGPSARLRTPTVDLGNVKTEEITRAILEVRNEGSEPLKISAVEFGCGCTKATFPPSIPPGTWGAIDILFSPDPDWSGPREEKGTLRTNDPKHPELSFSVKANLQPSVEIQPASPVIIPFVPGTELKAAITLKPRHDHAAGFTSSVRTIPGIVVTETSANQFALQIGPSWTRPGDRELPIPIHTSLGEKPYVLLLQASAGPVSNPSAPRRPQNREQIRRTTSSRIPPLLAKWNIKVVGVQGPKILRLELKKSGDSYRLKAFLRAATTPQILTGEIEVRTSDPKFPRLGIPVAVRVGPAASP